MRRASVVVPSFRRPAALERCLAALAAQTLPAAAFEIIVVHDGPSETTRRLVAQWAKTLAARGGPRVRYHSPPHRGPAAARNAGWRLAEADVVAFTDDDTVPAPGWLAAALAAMRPGVDAAWGRIVVPLPTDPTDYEIDAARLSVSQFVTANCFCRKSVLERLGGFDERFERAWREDSDLYFRLIDGGARVVHAADAVVVHPVRPASWGVSLAQQRKVLYDALLFKKHRALYRERIRGTPRWDYYLIVASLLGAAAALAADVVLAAAATGALWLVLTGRFCAERLRPATKKLSHVTEMIVTSILIPPIAVFWRLVGAFRYRVVFL
ncbi:MAG TPA: glycosyltransferase [Gammaproteobacteria bacterium]